MMYSIKQKGICIIISLGIIAFLIIKLFNNENKAIIIHQEMMTIDKENSLLDDEWGKIYDERDPVLRARMLRAHTRNPQLRRRYLIVRLNLI
jgi:hypothetical protein